MNYSDAPLVSVLMTAYNREKYIAEAIESVLTSSYNNFELIIVDDCSTDNTVKIAQSYEKTDKRISIYVNEKNVKQFKNRNKAASMAKGEYILYVDSDDTVLYDGIENLVKTMESFPLSSFGMYWANASSSIPVEINSRRAISNHFFNQPFLQIGPGGTVLKRNFFLKIKGYTDKYDAAGDMYFNLKACCQTSIVLLPFDFMKYRRHDGQALNTPFEYLYNNYLYLKDALYELPLLLTEDEKSWLEKKNKRRFSINLLKFFFKTLNISKTKFAIAKANFSIKDFLQGIFH